MNVVRSALIQARATPDKESMVAKHLAMLDEAAAKGAQIACLQELFFGPYFPQVLDKKWFDYAEPIPGPTVSRLQEVAKKHRMVVVAPIFESVDAGVYYNTASVIDADGALLGVYRKIHIPYAFGGSHEKFYFKPGNRGYPVFTTAYARIGVLICYDRQFPEGARILGLRGAQIVYIPAATWRGLVDHLWFIGQRAHAAANGYFVGTLNRVGVEELGPAEFYGSSYFCDPRGTIIAQASDSEEEVLVADLDLDLIKETRDHLPLFRDRRPETYHDIVEFIP